MNTNVVNVGRAPTYGNAWSTAGQAINEGLQSVLGYYQQYQQQKRFEANQAQDAKWKAMEMADRAEQHKMMRDAQQDQIDQRRAAEWEKNAPMMTESQALALPEYTQTTLTQPTAEQMGAAPDTGGAAAPLAPPKKELLRAKKFGNYTGFADFGGQHAAELKKRERIESGQSVPATPQLTAELDKLGLGHYTDVVPAAIMGLYSKSLSDTATAERDDKRYASAEKIAGMRHQETLDKLAQKSAKERAYDIHPELSGHDLLAAITAESPGEGAILKKVLANQLDLAKTSSIRGDRREMLAGLASRIDESYDMARQPTRAKMRNEYAVGKVAANVRSINTAINHLATLDKAVKTLDPSQYPWLNKGINWFKTNTGKGDIAAVKNAMLATATEMAAALKGGSAAPSETEIQEQLKVLNQNSSPEQWSAIIRQRAELLSARLNAARQGWVDEFGREPDRPLVRSDSRASLRGLGLEDLLEETGSDVGAGVSAGTTSNPFGLKRPGRQ